MTTPSPYILDVTDSCSVLVDSIVSISTIDDPRNKAYEVHIVCTAGEIHRWPFTKKEFGTLERAEQEADRFRDDLRDTWADKMATLRLRRVYEAKIYREAEPDPAAKAS